MTLKTLALLTVAAVSVAFAQEAPKKKAAAGPLMPAMTPVGDPTYTKPMGSMGSKDGGWTQTTMAAGVDGKPRAGKAITAVGEIVEFSCYLQLGKHGEKHRACGQKCINNGQPVGLVTADGTLYMLMEEEHDPRRDGATSDFRKAAAEHTAHVMEVSGTLASHRGYQAIYVQGFAKK
ncbi:MAG: hypothetical protein JNM66_22545 [Bryobacterales bacterium]|nr:hypothetical protein [Bryobacterales bacterium]